MNGDVKALMIYLFCFNYNISADLTLCYLDEPKEPQVSYMDIHNKYTINLKILNQPKEILWTNITSMKLKRLNEPDIPQRNSIKQKKSVDLK